MQRLGMAWHGVQLATFLVEDRNCPSSTPDQVGKWSVHLRPLTNKNTNFANFLSLALALKIFDFSFA